VQGASLRCLLGFPTPKRLAELLVETRLRARRDLLPQEITNDGAFVEPRDRNRSQLVASPSASKAVEIRENRCRGLRPVAVSSAW
jgi:hypothetical protein